jgi:hypothetical protein
MKNDNLIRLSSADGRALVEKASVFARKAHDSIGQTRKGSATPYHVHPEQVAALVAEHFDDAEVVAAAHLHDVVEDVKVITEDDIGREFGSRVQAIVADLTDVSKPSDGNRRRRKEIDRAHTAAASYEAKSVKCADVVLNGHDFIDGIGRDGQEDFLPVWFSEKRLLLDVLKDAHPVLFSRARAIVDEYFDNHHEAVSSLRR